MKSVYYCESELSQRLDLHHRPYPSIKRDDKKSLPSIYLEYDCKLSTV